MSLEIDKSHPAPIHPGFDFEPIWLRALRPLAETFAPV
jgi:hypothetical protein